MKKNRERERKRIARAIHRLEGHQELLTSVGPVDLRLTYAAVYTIYMYTRGPLSAFCSPSLLETEVSPNEAGIGDRRDLISGGRKRD